MKYYVLPIIYILLCMSSLIRVGYSIYPILIIYSSIAMIIVMSIDGKKRLRYTHFIEVYKNPKWNNSVTAQDEVLPRRKLKDHLKCGKLMGEVTVALFKIKYKK